MNNRLLLLILICFNIKAQSKLNFNYDTQGNQISRILCINCTAKQNKEVIENNALEENVLQSFYEKDIISYYPNPVKEELYLRWQLIDGNYVSQIRVYEVSGNLMYNADQLNSQNNITISFGSFSSGIYLVLLTYKNGEDKTIKIIKK